MSQSPPERSCTSACDCSPFSFAVLSPQGASAAGREADLCRRSTAGAVSGSYDERLAPTSTSDGELTACGLRRESSRLSTPSSFGVPSPTDARNASTPTIGVSAPRSETSLKCCPAAPLGVDTTITACALYTALINTTSPPPPTRATISPATRRSRCVHTARRRAPAPAPATHDFQWSCASGPVTSHLPPPRLGSIWPAPSIATQDPTPLCYTPQQSSVKRSCSGASGRSVRM